MNNIINVINILRHFE